MTLAFKASLPTTQKFVLVALCDSANDQGECYPSVPTLAEKCSMGVRTVQEAIVALEAVGCLRREFRAGRSTVYWLDPAAELSTTPAPAASRASRIPQEPHPTPAGAAPPPPQEPHPTPAPAAPITVNEPSVEPPKKQKKPPALTVDASLLVEAGFSPEVADEFIACKAERKAPLTPRAWADHLREASKAGWTPLAAAEKVMAKTWKGFEAKYVSDEARPGLHATTTETYAQRAARERVAQMSPRLAAKAPGECQPYEVIDGSTKLLA